MNIPFATFDAFRVFAAPDSAVTFVAGPAGAFISAAMVSLKGGKLRPLVVLAATSLTDTARSTDADAAPAVSFCSTPAAIAVCLLTAAAAAFPTTASTADAPPAAKDDVCAAVTGLAAAASPPSGGRGGAATGGLSAATAEGSINGEEFDAPAAIGGRLVRDAAKLLPSLCLLCSCSEDAPLSNETVGGPARALLLQTVAAAPAEVVCVYLSAEAAAAPVKPTRTVDLRAAAYTHASPKFSADDGCVAAGPAVVQYTLPRACASALTLRDRERSKEGFELLLCLTNEVCRKSAACASATESGDEKVNFLSSSFLLKAANPKLQLPS